MWLTLLWYLLYITVVWTWTCSISEICINLWSLIRNIIFVSLMLFGRPITKGYIFYIKTMENNFFLTIHINSMMGTSVDQYCIRVYMFSYWSLQNPILTFVAHDSQVARAASLKTVPTDVMTDKLLVIVIFTKSRTGEIAVFTILSILTCCIVNKKTQLMLLIKKKKHFTSKRCYLQFLTKWEILFTKKIFN